VRCAPRGCASPAARPPTAPRRLLGARRRGAVRARAARRAGTAGPTLALKLALGFDRARRAVTVDVDGRVARLAAGRAPRRRCRRFDLDALALALRARAR